MENLIRFLTWLNTIAFIFFCSRYIKKKYNIKKYNIKDAIAYAVTSILMCVSLIITFDSKHTVIILFEFYVFLVNFWLAICGIVKIMNKKKEFS